MSQANFAPYLECSIELAVDLVNTLDGADGTDKLTDPEALAEFLKAHKVDPQRRPSRQDLEQVKVLRSRLHDVFEAPDQASAVEILNTLLASSGARPELTNHDGSPWHLHYTPQGTPPVLWITAEAAMALSVVIAQEGFERLRTCEGERCVDVFVDESRNRSRRYCSPHVCGNRASVAAFRARQRASRSPA